MARERLVRPGGVEPAPATVKFAADLVEQLLDRWSEPVRVKLVGPARDGTYELRAQYVDPPRLQEPTE